MKRKPVKSGNRLDRRIHLEYPSEAVFWSKKFEVSCSQILHAIRTIGSNRAEDVAAYLSRQMIYEVYR